MVLKLHAIGEGFVYRAAFGDLREPLLLCSIEIALDVNIAGDVVDQTGAVVLTIQAILGMYPCKIVACGNRLKREALVLAIQGDGRARAGGQRT